MWEYTSVEGWTNNAEDLILRLNAAGSTGWEAIGIASSDKTLGVNSYMVIMRRKVLDWPSRGVEPEWAPDPTGRYPQRYWDGLRWTQHVTTDDGTAETDFPNRRSP